MLRLIFLMLAIISVNCFAKEQLRSQHTLLPFPSTITLFTSVDEPAVLMVRKPKSETFEFVSTVSPLSKYQYYEPNRSGNYYFRLIRQGETLGRVRVRSIAKPSAALELPDEMFTYGNYPIHLSTDCHECKVLIQVERNGQQILRSQKREFSFEPTQEGVYQFYSTVLVTDPETGLDSLPLSAEHRVSVNVRKPYSISAFINFPNNTKIGDDVELSLIVPGLTKNKECYIKVDGNTLYGCSKRINTDEWSGQFRLYLEAQVISKDSYHIPTTSHLDLLDPMLDQDNMNVEYLGKNLYLVDTELGDRIEVETNDEAFKYTKFGPAILIERNLLRQYIFRSYRGEVQLTKVNIYEKSAKDLDVDLSVKTDKSDFIAPFNLELDINVSKFERENIRSIELYHNERPMLVRSSRISFPISESGEHTFELVLRTKSGIEFSDSVSIFVEGNIQPSCEIQTNLDDGYFNARCQDQDGYIQAVEWFVNGVSVSSRRKISIPSVRFEIPPIVRFEVIDNLNAIRNYSYDYETNKWSEE